MIYQLNVKKYSHFSPLNINLKTIYCSLFDVLVAVKCCTLLFDCFCLSLRVLVCILY